MAWIGNMAAVEDASGAEITVLFDWAITGYAAPGVEIADLIWTSLLEFKLDVRDAPRFEAALLDSYLGGLVEAGWQGDPRLVRRAYLVGSVLICGLAPEAVDHALSEDELAALERQYGWPIDRMIAQAAAVTDLMFDRADELRALLKADS